MHSKSDTSDNSTQIPTEPDGLAISESRLGPSHADIIRRLIGKGLDTASVSAETLPTSASPRLAPGKAASTAFCRAAEMMYNLPAYPQSSDFKSVSLAELSELLPEQSLFALIEGKNEDLGVVALCPSTVSSLIEMQAVGRISSHPTRLRKPTRTDAIITADFVAALLKELGKELVSFSSLPEYSNFSYASFMDDPRPMLLMLEDRPLNFLSMRFRLGASGQKDGQVIIAVPFDEERTKKTKLSEIVAPESYTLGNQPVAIDPAGPKQAIKPKERRSLAAPVSQAPVQVIGVLSRKMMTLSALKRLSSGDLIPLSSGALDHARIETVAGQVLAHGRLGEADSYHAICLRGHSDDAGLEQPQNPNLYGALQSSTLQPPGKQTVDEVDLSQPDPFRTWPQSEKLHEMESREMETKVPDKPTLSSHA